MNGEMLPGPLHLEIHHDLPELYQHRIMTRISKEFYAFLVGGLGECGSQLASRAAVLIFARDIA